MIVFIVLANRASEEEIRESQRDRGLLESSYRIREIYLPRKKIAPFVWERTYGSKVTSKPMLSYISLDERSRDAFEAFLENKREKSDWWRECYDITMCLSEPPLYPEEGLRIRGCVMETLVLGNKKAYEALSETRRKGALDPFTLWLNTGRTFSSDGGSEPESRH